jgi:hypothetical protein
VTHKPVAWPLTHVALAPTRACRPSRPSSPFLFPVAPSPIPALPLSLLPLAHPRPLPHRLRFAPTRTRKAATSRATDTQAGCGSARALSARRRMRCATLNCKTTKQTRRRFRAGDGEEGGLRLRAPATPPRYPCRLKLNPPPFRYSLPGPFRRRAKLTPSPCIVLPGPLC